MVEIIAASQAPPPVRRALSRSTATLVMALLGGVAAGLVNATNGGRLSWPDAEALAILAPCGAFAAGVIAWGLMGWAIENTRFGWGVAMIFGVLTALLSYVPFGVLFGALMAILEAWDGRIESGALRFGVIFAFFSMVAGPIWTGHIVLPLGALGGLICRALSSRVEE
ncbi:MAG: hypothetical protein KTR21_12825 [Rhodobacteraceae bacterium]|nr:hypothetical protein [Paracoccaceae bacterium]